MAAGGVLVGPAPAGAAVATRCDFDGDGYADLAVGAPLARAEIGTVLVYRGRAGIGLTDDAVTQLDQVARAEGDRMGWSLAAGDLDGDGIDDLVVGAPGDRAPGWADPVGSVQVFRGDGTIATAYPRVEFGAAEFLGGGGPGFGWSVAVGRFAGDGPAELAVGAPFMHTRPSARAATEYQTGRVYTLRDRDGSLAHRWMFDQDNTQIGPGAEDMDRFGWSLTAGDLDGDGYDDLAVGVPFEEVGAAKDSGELDLLGGGENGLGGPGTVVVVAGQVDGGGVAEAGDWFGFSLTAGDRDGDGRADLAVGAPHEEVDAATLAGAVFRLPGAAVGLIGPGDVLTQGPSRSGARFGMSVGTVALTGPADLVVGIPGEPGPSAMPGAVNAGAVLVVPSATGGTPLLLQQDTPAPHPVAGTREAAFVPMPWDDTTGEPLDPDAEATGEWFGWAIAT